MSSFGWIEETIDKGPSRRQLLRRIGGGFGAVALAQLLQQEGVAAEDPYAPKAPHFAGKAKQVIYIVLNGGMSQVDTFDPKPMLTKFHGTPMPGGPPKTERTTGNLMRSPFAFLRHGQSEIEASEIFPKLGALLNEFTVIRSMYTDVPNHEPSLFLANCGAIQPGRPSLGSWLMYGLGTENRNLPGFVVLCPGVPVVGPPLWESAFLPAVYQGTYINATESDAKKLIRYLDRPGRNEKSQRAQLELLAQLNRQHLASRDADPQLEATIRTMETAFRMQTEAPEVLGLQQEPEAVRQRYTETPFGRSCLVARRLIEKGVRMVQLYYGNVQPWDSHDDIMGHRHHARLADAPIAALVEDLRERGLLDSTIVVVGTEFGRTPSVENSGLVKVHAGRDHNSYGYSILVAGGGFRRGYVHGATDDFGFRAVEKPVHPHDFNATLLHALGLDHTRLTYAYSGRNFRLTDVHGVVQKEMLA